MKSFEELDIKINPNGGDQQYTACPKCSHTRKKKRVQCLSVNVLEGIYNCHHCGWSGSIRKGEYGVSQHNKKPVYRLPKMPPVDEKSVAKTLSYLNKRGITNDVQLRNKLTTAKVFFPQIGKETSALGFPLYRNGVLINIKWRSANKHFRMEGGCELIPYKLDDIKEADTVIWVEGEIDALSLEVAGFKNAISVPNGAPSLKSQNFGAHFDYLRNCEGYIADKSHILFCDSDEAGRRLEDELARRLGHDKCKRVRLPEGFKDANEYLIENGPEALADVINDAQEYPVKGLYSVASVAEDVFAVKERGLVGGIKTGWPELDQFYSVMTGRWTLVTGIPNHGKSTFLDCMLVNLATNNDWRIGMFSPENQPIRRHIIGLIEKKAKKQFNTLDDLEVGQHLNWLHSHFFWILPDFDADWSLEGVLALAKVLVYRQGINGLVIDPWNELQHKIPQGYSETDYISHALSKIRQFAHEANIHIWVVAHPTKLQKDLRTNKYPVPRPYDVSGSSHWNNKADLAFAVYREDFNKDVSPVSVNVQKVRFAEDGRVGRCVLTYDPELCNYRSRSEFD